MDNIIITTEITFDSPYLFSNIIDELFTMIEQEIIFQDNIEIAILQTEQQQELQKNDNIKINIKKDIYKTEYNNFPNCIICSDEFKKNEEIAILECNHIYHINCINEWGFYKQECPLCKKVISHS